MRYLIILLILSMLLVSCGKQEDTSLSIPDLGGREVSVACWIDTKILCQDVDGSLAGIVVDYYTESCKILNCVAVFFKTDSTNLRNMLSDGSVDTAFLGQITQQRMGIAASQLSPVTNRYGMYVRKNNNQWKTIEDLIEDKNAIIPIRTDWPLPDIHALFKDHKQLNDWPLTSNQELLSRGLVDAIMDAGVLRDGIITYAEVNFDQTYLDGNTTDYLRFTPAFTVGNEDLVKPFDIATAFLVYNGTMDAIIDRHVTGVQMPYRERVIK